MQKAIDKSVFDWQRGRTVGIQSRGIASLVVARIKSSDVIMMVSNESTRCVWPTSSRSMDSRFLSRRMWVGR